MLRQEGVRFQVCKNQDDKCAVVESAYPTYFTYKNTYRYIEGLPKFIKA
jgi:hypothetical protein